jgi:dynein assembly factor 1
MIYLQQNQISVIENLNHLKNLVSINLSQNCISKIEGLRGLDNLLNLDLHGNLIPDTAACEELLLLPNLSNLDLKDN